MWVLYLSFVNVGQTFYAFGWESLLLEAGFFSIFLGSRAAAPQMVMIVLVRRLCFGVMFGAGLIKLCGDPPLEAGWTRYAGVWVNHFAELVAPFGYFLSQPIASIFVIVTIVFQTLIMASGNLSWLNLLTIVLAIPALDDRFLRVLLPVAPAQLHAPSLSHKIAVAALAVLVAVLSVRPIAKCFRRARS